MPSAWETFAVMKYKCHEYRWRKIFESTKRREQTVLGKEMAEQNKCYFSVNFSLNFSEHRVIIIPYLLYLTGWELALRAHLPNHSSSPLYVFPFSSQVSLPLSIRVNSAGIPRKHPVTSIPNFLRSCDSPFAPQSPTDCPLLSVESSSLTDIRTEFLLPSYPWKTFSLRNNRRKQIYRRYQRMSEISSIRKY